jgi:acyl carrier protein
MGNIRDTIKQFILDRILSETDPATLTDSTQLKDTGILDSLSTLRLASFLEEKFHVSLEARDLEEGNFSSIEHIEQLLKAKIRAD